MTMEMKHKLPHFTVNVLGTEYTVYLGSYLDFGMKENVDGDCEVMSKTIRLRTDMKEDWDGDKSLLTKYVRHVLIHELAHAFFFESGMLDYFDDERIIEWLEVNATKLVQTAQIGDSTLLACLAALDSPSDS